MSNTAKLKKKATELEQKKQFDKALQLYIQLLDEAGRDLDDSDLQLYNRVGDLLMRQGNTSEALSYYEKAVDVYAERGFLNNAIALCSKILRQSPARTAVYYKLGKISASKGFKSDAKKNFLEYADRMQKAGQRDEAYRALKEFADLCPDQDDIRLMLAEMLSKENRKDEALDQLQTLYEKLEEEGRGAEARATLDRMKAIDPAAQPRSSGTYRSQKSNDLVFLDLSADLGGREPSAPTSGSPEPPQTRKHVTTPDIPALDGLTFHFVPDEGLDSVQEPAPQAIEGLQSTLADAQALDDASIDALLTMPEALHTLEQTSELDAEIPPPALPDLEPTAVSNNDAIDLTLEPPSELSGWEPTAANAPHASATPILAPLIEDPLLSGEEFAALQLQNTTEPRPTPVHDLLLPTQLPLLTPPIGADSLGPDMVAVDSPSPIDLPALDDAEETAVDLVTELLAPISRDDKPTSDGPDAPPEPSQSAVATDPLGTLVVHAEVSVDSTEAAELDAPDEPDVEIEAEPVDVGDLAPAAMSALDAVEQSPVSPTSSEVVDAELEERRIEATASALSDESIDAAFESAAGEPVVSGPEAVPAPSEPDALPEAPAESTEEQSDLLADAPGFGEGDLDAGTFVPSPRLSTLTLQPDAWSSETPEVLIDGEWHDEHVADAAHVTSDDALDAAPRRFDDLAAAMMWIPPEDAAGGADGAAAGAPDEGATFALHTPRSHLSFGGVEDQLRRRLELVPENWALRRQLGEVLLDSGDRDAGLYELDLAMVGYELSGDLHGAMEVADEIVRLQPASVRHHQKRVEYAVRSGDRLRLTDAYMELGDALFRDGQADKAHAVYARVLELSPGHERAQFALGNLAPGPDPLAEDGGRTRPLTYITPEDAFAEWEAPAHVLGAFVSARSGEQPVTPDESEPEVGALTDAHDGIEEAAPSPLACDDAGVQSGDDESEPAPDHTPDFANVASEDVHASVRRDEFEAAIDRAADAANAASDSDQASVSQSVRDAHAAEEAPSAEVVSSSAAGSIDAPIEPGIEAASERTSLAETDPAQESVTLEPARSAEPDEFEASSGDDARDGMGSALDTASLKREVERRQAPESAAAELGQPEREEPPILKRARSLTPVGGRDDEFIDLGDWLRSTEPEKTTRMVVEESRPTGDEQADFDEMLRRFKRGVAENVEDEDFASHYDLGVAYKEMGLVDEAIAQFQRALRGESHRIRSYEALGQCFVEKGQHAVASALLQRAVETSQVDDTLLVGVLYLLGYSMEALGRQGEAMRYYQRVFAVDIEFRDVAQRVAAMEHQTT